MIENEKKDFAAGLPLPLERAGRTAAEQCLFRWEPIAGRGAAEPTTAEQSFFRGEPITWLIVPTTKTVVTANVFGDSEASERPGRKNNFILYGGKQYKREDFYQMAFR